VFLTVLCPIPILDNPGDYSGPELLPNILNMPPKKKTLTVAEKERIAAQMLAASEGLISTAEAMKMCGLTSPQRSESRKKRVYRNAQKIKVVSANEASTIAASSFTAETPRQLVMGSNAVAQDQSVSYLSAPPSTSPSNTTQQGPITREQDELRRQLLDDAIKIDEIVPKRRRYSQQKHMEESEKNKKKERINLLQESLSPLKLQHPCKCHQQTPTNDHSGI